MRLKPCMRMLLGAACFFAMPARNRERTPLTELHVSVNFNFMADAVALDGEDPRALPSILRKTTLAPSTALTRKAPGAARRSQIRTSWFA